MSLRLGVMCAVIDDSGCLLLSQRGDLNTWNLPGGRLDGGETLEEAAIREVEEETGIRAETERAVALYYLAGWRRVNILYAGFPLGGELRDKTRETRANRYFRSGSLPQNVRGAKEALASLRPQPQVISTTRNDLLRLRLRFGWRWLVNRLSGHPEPKFPVFTVHAAAVILGDASRRVLTLPADSAAGFRTLPRVVCDGEAPPWEQMAQAVQRVTGETPDLHWVGLWQDAERGSFEFVFAATISERELSEAAQWTVARNAVFGDHDVAYVERIRSTYARDPVWTMTARHEPTDMVIAGREAKS